MRQLLYLLISFWVVSIGLETKAFAHDTKTQRGDEERAEAGLTLQSDAYQALQNELSSFIRCPVRERDGKIDPSTQIYYMKRLFNAYRMEFSKNQKDLFRKNEGRTKSKLDLNADSFSTNLLRNISADQDNPELKILTQKMGNVYLLLSKTTLETTDPSALKEPTAARFLKKAQAVGTTDASAAAKAWDDLWKYYATKKDTFAKRGTQCDEGTKSRFDELKLRESTGVKASAKERARVENSFARATDHLKEILANTTPAGGIVNIEKLVRAKSSLDAASAYASDEDIVNVKAKIDAALDNLINQRSLEEKNKFNIADARIRIKHLENEGTDHCRLDDLEKANKCVELRTLQKLLSDPSPNAT